jgi:tetratricopeptide (TPR) repeat protein
VTKPFLPILTLVSIAASTAQAQGTPPSGTDEVDPLMEAAESELDDDAARRHFTAGRGLYDVGRFDQAAIEFEEAHRLSGRPALLYNLYIAYRDAGNIPKAAENLRRYLQEMPDVEDRVNLRARLEQLEAQAARESDVQSQLEQQQRELEERRRREQLDDGGPSPLPWIVAGVGGAALVAGTITGILALGATSTLEENCPDPNNVCSLDYEDFDEDLDTAETLVTTTDWLLLGGGIVAAAGITWGIIALASDGEEEALPATVSCSGDGCTAVVSTRF